jgi:arylformamidase
MPLIDLSPPLIDGQPAYPGDPQPVIEEIASLDEAEYRLTRLCMTAHQGSHVDAPSHFVEDGASIDKLPLERFLGPVLRIDLREKDPNGNPTPATADLKIDINRLRPYEEAFQPGARILLHTGWASEKYGRTDYYTPAPELSIEAARWIADHKIGLLGIDFASPSFEESDDIHRILLGADPPIVLLENLCHLEKTPDHFTLIAFPLSLPGCEASPVRAVALIE